MTPFSVEGCNIPLAMCVRGEKQKLHASSCADSIVELVPNVAHCARTRAAFVRAVMQPILHVLLAPENVFLRHFEVDLQVDFRRTCQRMYPRT